MQKIIALMTMVAVIGCKEGALMSGTEKDKPVAETAGRYQIVESRSDTFFIDTQRGRVWFLRPEMKVGGYDYEPHFWPITIIDGENKIGMDSAKWWTLPKRFQEAMDTLQMEREVKIAKEEIKLQEAKQKAEQDALLLEMQAALAEIEAEHKAQ